MNGAQLLRLSAILVTGPPALQFNSDDLKRNDMADIEIFLRGIVASVYREYGILGVVAVALAVFLVVIALGFLKIAWIRRNELKAWIVGKCKDNPRVAFSTAAFAGLIVFSFLFLPSSPFIVALWVTAGVALLIKSIRSRLIAARKLRIYLLGMLACVALTLGGMCHDVVFPPTGRWPGQVFHSRFFPGGLCPIQAASFAAWVGKHKRSPSLKRTPSGDWLPRRAAVHCDSISTTPPAPVA
jgi:hypothetical protein